MPTPYQEHTFRKQYAGSQFWAFSEKTFYKVLTYIKEHRSTLEDYYRYTSSPDEVYFHSILINLQQTDTQIKLKPQITYVNYFRKNNVFLSEDLKTILSQKEKLFARKFDTEIDREILNKLDHENHTNIHSRI